jgi:hypothetical protein
MDEKDTDFNVAVPCTSFPWLLIFCYKYCAALPLDFCFYLPVNFYRYFTGNKNSSSKTLNRACTFKRQKMKFHYNNSAIYPSSPLTT